MKVSLYVWVAGHLLIQWYLNSINDSIYSQEILIKAAPALLIRSNRKFTIGSKSCTVQWRTRPLSINQWSSLQWSLHWESHFTFKYLGEDECRFTSSFLISRWRCTLQSSNHFLWGFSSTPKPQMLDYDFLTSSYATSVSIWLKSKT